MIFNPAYYLINILNTHSPYCITAVRCCQPAEISATELKSFEMCVVKHIQCHYCSRELVGVYLLLFYMYFLQMRLLGLF
jgi:hypothetical protein